MCTKYGGIKRNSSKKTFIRFTFFVVPQVYTIRGKKMLCCSHTFVNDLTSVLMRKWSIVSFVPFFYWYETEASLIPNSTTLPSLSTHRQVLKILKKSKWKTGKINQVLERSLKHSPKNKGFVMWNGWTLVAMLITVTHYLLIPWRIPRKKMNLYSKYIDMHLP